jgi:DNA-binding response OmpR family regulator
MSAKDDLLKGKKILIVDDEPDVLDTLQELLDMCNVVKAGTFEEAKRQLETQPLDMAVLDIMGVNGYNLLEIAVVRKVTAVMFTAHALSPEDTMKSFRGGAAYYVPKDKMAEMPEILAKIQEAKDKGQSTWMSFMDWADVYYSAKFGPSWAKHRKEFQEKLK